MPRTESVPSAEVANQAVNVAVHGNKTRVTLTTAQAASGGEATVNPEAAKPAKWWTRSRVVGAIVVGVATVGATVIAWLQFIQEP